MKLVKQYNSKDRNVSRKINNPSKDEIINSVKSLDWSKVCYICLERGKDNFLDCSGSYNDGFCISYTEAKNTFISNDDIESTEEFITVLTKYFDSDESWKKLYSWSNLQDDDENVNDVKILRTNPLVLVIAFFKVIHKFSKPAFYLVNLAILYFIVRMFI
jgi:hypothetical protein